MTSAEASLRRENDMLHARVMELERLLKDADAPVPVAWGLSKPEEKILQVMVALPLATYDAIYDALYWDRRDNMPDQSIVKVYVCKMRPKLARHGIEIENVWGRGYRLPEAQRQELRKRPVGRPRDKTKRKLRPRVAS